MVGSVLVTFFCLRSRLSFVNTLQCPRLKFFYRVFSILVTIFFLREPAQLLMLSKPCMSPCNTWNFFEQQIYARSRSNVFCPT